MMTKEQLEYHKEKNRRWRAIPKNAIKVRKGVRLWQALNIEKKRAHSLLWHHMKVGNIIRPSFCDKCKLKAKLDGHHKDYTKPLVVDWLCRPCHRPLHPKKIVLTKRKTLSSQ